MFFNSRFYWELAKHLNSKNLTCCYLKAVCHVCHWCCCWLILHQWRNMAGASLYICVACFLSWVLTALPHLPWSDTTPYDLFIDRSFCCQCCVAVSISCWQWHWCGWHQCSSHIGCVAGAGGTTDSTLNSSSRKVAIVSRSIVIRSSCSKESKFSLPLNCRKQRQLTVFTVRFTQLLMNGFWSSFEIPKVCYEMDVTKTGNGKQGMGNREWGTGNGVQWTLVWERVYSSNSPDNSKWRAKEKAGVRWRLGKFSCRVLQKDQQILYVIILLISAMYKLLKTSNS